MDQQVFENDAATVHCPVVPGERVGPFRLGMSLHEALGVMRKQTGAMSDGSGGSASEQTQIIFSRTSPVDKPVIVDVQNLGVRLRFEPKTQRLYVIDAYDVGKMPMSFQGHVFGGPGNAQSDAASLRSLYEILGVTHSGSFNDELGRDAFCLQYPGLLIAFRVPREERVSGIPLVLADGTSPRVLRLFIHDLEFPKQPFRCVSSAQSSRTVDVIVRDDKPPEVVFRQFNNATLVVGESYCQDVLSSFGGPSKTHIKRYEPIGTLVRRQAEMPSASQVEDYFYNFADLGVDMLFDGAKHVLRKVVLRTNLIAHPAFGQYAKCSFTVKFVETGAQLSNGSTATTRKGGKTKKPAGVASFEELLTGTASSGKSSGAQEKQVACDDHWLIVARKLDIGDEQPMVHERADQPFGPCHLFGYRRSVFEVDKVSQQICSLTVF